MLSAEQSQNNYQSSDRIVLGRSVILLPFGCTNRCPELANTNLGVVPSCQARCLIRAESRRAQLTVEPSTCTLPHPARSENPSDARECKACRVNSHAQSRNDLAQSSSPPSLPKLMFMPFFPSPMMSLRLIMYPLAMSIASSFGIPASTSFV